MLSQSPNKPASTDENTINSYPLGATPSGNSLDLTAEAIPIGYFPPRPNPASFPQGYVPPQHFTLPSQPYVQESPQVIPSSPLEYSPAEAIPIGYFPPKPNAISLPQSYPYGYVPPQNFTLPSQPYVQASPLTNSEAEAKPSGSPDQPFVPALTFHPSFEVTPDGDIVSHDPVLNSNGAALHRFILDRLHPPTIHLHLCGSHREGDQTVKDFEFVIDLSGSLLPNVADMYTLADDEFAFRGETVREVLVSVPAGNASVAEHGHHRTRTADPDQQSQADDWAKTRKSSGLPPWVTRRELEQGRAGTSPALGSSLSLRQWIDRYCASTKSMKQFNFNKVPYGLNLSAVEDCARRIFHSTGGRGDVKVFLKSNGGRIKIRASSEIFQMMANNVVKVVLWIFLIYPCLWFCRYFSVAGGKWDLCGAAYPLIKDPRDMPASGPMTDGDWIRIWERTIRLGIKSRIQSRRPIRRPVADDASVITFD